MPSLKVSATKNNDYKTWRWKCIRCQVQNMAKL